MDIQKEYKDWYKTEGIRTFPQNGEHFHNFYTEIAFMAGANSVAKAYERELEEIDLKMSVVKKLIRRLLSIHRKN